MAYVYIGKTFKRLNLLTNRIYKEYPAEKVAKLKEAGFSLAGQLFVKPEELAGAKIEVTKGGTVRNEAMKQLEYFLTQN